MNSTRRRSTSATRSRLSGGLFWYADELVADHITFPGPHLLPAADNWQEVADYTLTWALEQTMAEEPAAVQLSRLENSPEHAYD